MDVIILLLAELVQAVQQINTNYDGQKLLDTLKAVDGAGSGLDADLLDGQHADYYATADDLSNISGNVAAYNCDSIDDFEAELWSGDAGEMALAIAVNGDVKLYICAGNDDWYWLDKLRKV